MRIAIISCPRSGNTLVRKVFSDLIKAKNYAFHFPSEINWSGFPKSCVLQIHWETDEELIRSLEKNSFKIVTVSRNPADILLSILHFCNHEPNTANWLGGQFGDEAKIKNIEPISKEFREYVEGERAGSLLSISIAWAKLSGVQVLKYEDFFERPQHLAKKLHELIRVPVGNAFEVILKHTVTNIGFNNRNLHYWRANPNNWMSFIDKETYNLIYGKFSRYFETFGYEKYCGEFISLRSARRNWHQFFKTPKNRVEETNLDSLQFVSYAQNFEDVMLWRLFKNYGSGFYIDVGANDPERFSVTKSFYEKGWKGINIEPVQEWFELLEDKRPRDINLNLAVDLSEDEKTFYQIENSGLSTLNKKIAAKHASEGRNVSSTAIPTQTLTNICKQNVKDEIHFLKIDVEGNEANVIKSLDLSLYRPWVIVIEATLPLSKEESHEGFDAYLLNANYEFCYFDGINRFYLSAEKRELSKYLETPPNFFDNFTSFECYELTEEKIALEKSVTDSRSREVELIKRLESTEDEYHKAVKSLLRLDEYVNESEINFSDLENRYKSLEALNAQRDETFSDLENRYKSLEALNAQRDETFSDLENRYKSLEALNAQRDETFSDLEKMHKLLESLYAKAEQAFSELENRFKTQEVLLSQIQSDNSLLKNSLESTRETLFLSESRILQIKEQSHNLAKETERLKKLIYGVSFDRHLYRSLAVLFGSKHYKRKG